jgi:acetoacetyl-CoA synthetase
MTTPLARSPIFAPDASAAAGSQLAEFMRFCEQRTGRSFAGHRELDEFAVAELREFWRLFLGWSGLEFEGSSEVVCTDDDCERAVFFPDLRLSYADNLLRAGAPGPALTACHAGRPAEHLTREELRARVAAVAVSLTALGLSPGERVVAVVRNDAEAVVAALAVLAVGATLATAAPDMGSLALLSRFEQLEPTMLLANLRDDGDSTVPLLERMAEVVRGLPSLRHVIATDDGPAPEGLGLGFSRLADLAEQGSAGAASFAWPRFEFNHPLFVMFSSGTTGPPKCIVHGAGGTLVEHVKEHRLHGDIGPGDTLFFQTSAAWMMWHWQLSALACGVRIVLYDGPVTGADTLWRIAAGERVTTFGTSPPYLQLCQDTGFSPRAELDLGSLRAVQSTGSILRDGQYDWFAEHVGALPLQSISGGTDIIGCFVLGSPVLPVFRGESQCRSLGLDVQALDPGDDGIGELVCRNPFPSRPLGFHGDPEGTRFHEAYFSQNPGIWTHGDLIEITPEGSARMHGRSDGVMNIRGIRIGPAEIYRVLQGMPQLRESMAIEKQTPEGSELVLLTVMRDPGTLDGHLEIDIRRELAQRASRAHVPARIVEVAELPMTHSGKRSERAARDAINDVPLANLEALRNPGSVDAIRRAFAGKGEAAGSQATPAPSAESDLIREIWERRLGLSPIGADDNFFDLGGSSLLAVQVVDEICRKLGIDLPLTALFEVPTIAGMAAAVREPALASKSRIEPIWAARDHPRWKRRLIDRLGRLLALPVVVMHRLHLIGFQGGGQLVSMVPGTLGLLVRRGWYRATLESCGEVSVGFGSLIIHPRARLGDRCTIAAYCMIGWVDMGDDVMVATHSVILGGPRQHGFADLDRPMRSQTGTDERVTIGSDVWLGAGSIVMANVAPHTIVAAGTTVTRTFAPYSVLGGAPAEVTGNRLSRG